MMIDNEWIEIQMYEMNVFEIQPIDDHLNLNLKRIFSIYLHVRSGVLENKTHLVVHLVQYLLMLMLFEFPIR